ncbi:MAG: hypothetical protein ACK5LY_07325 [Lachnospirales bacterium]
MEKEEKLSDTFAKEMSTALFNEKMASYIFLQGVKVGAISKVEDKLECIK